MAAGASPNPDPGAQPGAQPSPAASPSPDAGGGPPSQAPASQEQIMLAKLYQACKALAQQNPAMAPGLSKAAEGIQEAQTALVTQPKNQAPQQSPLY